METDTTFIGSVDETARRRFESAWRNGEPDSIASYLPPPEHPQFLPTLEELVHIDVEFRWKRSSAPGSAPPLIESYLERFPQLNHPPVLFRLLRQEYRARRVQGITPSPEEYRSRFPALLSTGEEVAQTLAEARVGIDSPPQIPGYEVLAPLGRGGMGVVYKARQLSLGRTVALKMILPGAQTGTEDRDRFRREAEAIARFQDPNVVHIYEVGECEGRLYFSMEFFEAGSLDKRLAHTPQPARESAAMVQTLAQAMQRVHERGIVHRDLKPGNVLLADDGTPKISDFGLAKQIEGAGQTMSGTIVGTPSYMAPEQASGNGKAVGPGADVYALGAILYEMLTGRPPFVGQSAVETAMQVVTDEPLAPRTLQANVPNDLETICLKCLEKEPERRYKSARELADDLGRFVRDEPICARPVGRVERVLRWSRRNPYIAAPLAALAVVLPLSIVALTMLWVRAEAHRQEALKNLETARRNSRKAHDAVDQLLTHLGYDKLVEIPHMEPAVRDVIETALRFNKSFLEEEGNDPAVRFEVCRAYRRAGWIQRILGEFAQAEQHFQSGVELADSLIAASPVDPEYRQELGVILSMWGELCESTGRLEQAESKYDRAQTVREQLHADFPSNVDYRHDLANVHDTLGNFWWRKKDDPEKASRALHRAVELYREGVRDVLDLPGPRYGLAGALDSLASYLQEAGRDEEMRRARREAVAISRELAEQYPRNTLCRNQLSVQLHNLAATYDLDQAEEAERLYRSALQTAQKLTEEFPSPPIHRMQLSHCYASLGDLMQRVGRRGEAEEAVRRAVEIREKLVAAFPQVPSYRARLASSYAALRSVKQSKTGDLGAEAVQTYYQAVEDFRKEARKLPGLPGHQQNLSSTLHSLGGALRKTSRFKEADLAIRECVDIGEKLLAQRPLSRDYRLALGSAYHELGVLMWDTGRRKEAEDAYLHSFGILSKLAADFPIAAYRYQLSLPQHGLAVVYRNTNRRDKAEEWHRKNIVLGEQLVKDFPKADRYRGFLNNVYMAFGLPLVSTGRHDEAEQGYRRALELNDSLLADAPGVPEYNNMRAGLLDNYAESLLDRKGDLKQALKFIEQAIQHEKLALKANPLHPQYLLFMSSHWGVLAEVQIRLGDHAAAVQAAKEIPKLYPADPKKYHTAAEYVARCVSVCAKDAKLGSEERMKFSHAYLADAVQLLRSAVQHGYRDVRELESNPHLAPLRGRQEFTDFLAEVTKQKGGS